MTLSGIKEKRNSNSLNLSRFLKTFNHENWWYSLNHVKVISTDSPDFRNSSFALSHFTLWFLLFIRFWCYFFASVKRSPYLIGWSDINGPGRDWHWPRRRHWPPFQRTRLRLKFFRWPLLSLDFPTLTCADQVPFESKLSPRIALLLNSFHASVVLFRLLLSSKLIWFIPGKNFNGYMVK